MATITAPMEIANDMPARPERPSSRPLWQAPVFVLGVAALVAAWQLRTLWNDLPQRRLERDLIFAREQLGRPDGDVEQALQVARRAFETAETLQDRAGEAALLVASAYVRLAEKAAEPARAADAWQRAWQYLDHAEKAGVSEEDQPRLQYRQAKVGLHVGDELPRIIARFEEATPRGGNRAEGYKLLTLAYLRLQPPDLTRALEANRRLRDVAEASEEEQDAAKLQGGELLMRLGKSEEARKTLERIGPRAAPALLVQARLLIARSYQDEKKWADAARSYQAALADTRAPLPEPGLTHYNLGLCYRHLEQPQEATRAWQDCLRLARGDEGPAAAIALAEQRLRQSAFEAVLEALTLAVARVHSAADWKNPLVDANKVVAVFDTALTAFREARRHDLAVKALEPYGRFAPPRHILPLRGEVCAEWARFRQEEFRQGKGTPGKEGEALELYRQAGDAYGQAADLPGLTPVEQGAYLWASASNYLTAQASELAIARLSKVVHLEVKPAIKGEAWYRLAEIHRANRNTTEAANAYRECMSYETRYAYLARYQLAMAALEAGDPDEAMMGLVLNVKMLRWESDPEALAQSLFTLGNLFYQRRDYSGVVRYLEDALRRFTDNPQFKDTPELTRARFQLADAYRQKAAQQNQNFLLGEKVAAPMREHHQNEHRRWLRQAADEFASLDEYLDKEPGREHLTAEQRSQVPFITAKCWFNLGEFEKALKIYERLIARYPAQVEGLDALGGAVSCHAAMGQKEMVQQRLLQISKMLPPFPPAVRDPWEKWVEDARKGLKGL